MRIMLARLALTLAALLGGAAITLRGSAFADDPTVALSSMYLTPGSSAPLSVHVEGMTDCASSAVVVSLMFPQPTERGYGPTEKGAIVSPTELTVDSSGSFEASLAAPGTFPGNWHGYVAVQGSCVEFGPARFLARVFVRVPLTSDVADELGVDAPSDATVLLIPSAEVRLIPVLGGETYRTPYEKLGSIRAFDVDSKSTCTAAAATDTNVLSSGGDIVIQIPKDSACARAGATTGLTVTNSDIDLLTRARPEPGWVTPVLLQWPAPDASESDETPAAGPGAPLAGTGADAPQGSSGQDGSHLWPTTLVLACLFVLVVGATVCCRRARRG